MQSIEKSCTSSYLPTAKESLANIGAGVKVVDIIVTYHEWIFSVAEKTETELNIQEGLKRLEAAKLGRTSNVCVGAVPAVCSPCMIGDNRCSIYP